MPTGMTRMARVAAIAGALMLVSVTSVLGQDASPPASPASPVPEAEPWGQVPFEAGLRDPDGASRITAVAAGPRGIVAIGAGATGAAAWYSADGLTWERATAPRSWSSVRTRRAPALEDVVATADGFIVVGTERDGPKRTYGNTGSVWASEDGLTWRRTARGVGPYLNHVVEHDGRLYAVSGPVAGRVEGAVWASDDATDWERVYTDPDDAGMEVIASDGETLVAGSLRGMTYSTDDGRTWNDATVEVGGAGAWLEDATAFGGGFLAVGARDDDGSAWHSVDGRSWAPVPETIDTGAYITHLNAVAPLPSGGVLVTAGTDEYDSYLYRSDDGATWGEPILHVAGEDDDSFEWPIEAVVAMEDRSLVLGHQPDGPRRFSAAVWTIPAPPVEATPSQVVTVCPGRRPTIEELVVMDPAARLDCYGDRDLTFRAWLAPHQYPDLEYFGLPHWLTAGVGGLRALPVAGDPSAAMSLVLHVRPSDRDRLDRRKARWAMVTGHFDDPKARSCTRRWRTDCRQAFVVAAIRSARAGARATSVAGTWRKLPESPFGAVLGNGVWAGDEIDRQRLRHETDRRL